MRAGSLVPRALFLALVIRLATSGCVAGARQAATGEDKGGPAKIEFWTISLKRNFGSYVQSLIDGYREQHPEVEITWVGVPGAGVKTKLQDQAAGRDHGRRGAYRLASWWEKNIG